MNVEYRAATDDDVSGVAALHADSWRRHYRGAYTDEYLDGPIGEERLRVWTERFARRDGTSTTVACADETLIGFVHVTFDAEPEFGPLVDNLHVRHDVQRTGAGRELMAHAARGALAARPGQPIHLWVLEQNDRAQAFYRAIG